MSNGKEVAIITTSYGDMMVEFFDDSAPKHVESFKALIENQIDILFGNVSRSKKTIFFIFYASSMQFQ